VPLLDSNILIYAVRPGFEFLNPWLVADEVRVSAISIPEILGFPHMQDHEETLLEPWLARLLLLDVDERVLRRAAVLRRQRSMKLGDALVAATALVHGLDLVTRNVRDFRHLGELNVINPFEAMG